MLPQFSGRYCKPFCLSAVSENITCVKYVAPTHYRIEGVAAPYVLPEATKPYELNHSVSTTALTSFGTYREKHERGRVTERREVM